MKKRRWLALALSLGLLLSVGAGASAGAVDSGGLTRGEFIDLLAAASGEDLSENAGLELTEYFTDGAGASDGVKWAFANWILNGCGGDKETKGALALGKPLTRQEAAALLGRYLDYQYTALPAGCGTGAPDTGDIADWARQGVSQCWMYGVMDLSGEKNVVEADGSVSSALAFRPLDPVSQREAETWIANANQVTASAVTATETPGFADSLVRAAATEGNWSLSPYSVRMCLAMLANGAKGETREELLRALQIDDLDAFNQQVKAQLATYDGYGRVMSLNTANSLWLNQSWFDGKGTILPDFSALLADTYRAQAQEVTNANSVERVNAWVNEKTQGKIPSILTEDNRDYVTALVNAVYFKAAWAQEFDPDQTAKAAFTNADGTAAPVDMMHRTDSMGYYATPGIQAVKLDYRNDAVDNQEGDNWEFFSKADFSMYLILGDDSLDVAHFLDTAVFQRELVRLSVPKFQVEYGETLDGALQALGVNTAYDKEKADLSGILDPSGLPYGQYFLDTVLHKTYVSVDEKGTEAAAVTAAMEGAGSALPSRPELVRTFTADGPFWFAIRDNASGELLFVGRYQKA